MSTAKSRRKARSAPQAAAKSAVAKSAVVEASSHEKARLAWLWILLGAGILCRFIGLNWDEGLHLHPDERFLTMTVPALAWPHSFGEYFDTARAPLNPFNQPNLGFFVYGQLPLLVVKAVAGLLGKDTYDGTLIVGRFLSALSDAGTVLLLLAIGRRLGEPMLGLIAATLLAWTALHLQHAHFFIVDTFATFFLTAAFLFALPRRDKPNRRDAVCCGLLWGAALACKISTVLFAPIIVLLLLMGRNGEGQAGALLPRRKQLGALATIFIVAFAAFRIGHPIAFRGESSLLTLGGLLDVRPVHKIADVEANPRLQRLRDWGLLVAEPGPQFWSAVKEQAEISNGDKDLPWNLQWIGRRDYLFPAQNLAAWGTGWPLVLAWLCGVIVLLRRLARRQKVPPGIGAATLWTWGVFLYHAGWYSKFTRYYLLLTPFLALGAAWFLILLWQRARGASWRRAALVLNVAVIGGTALWGLARTSIYTRPNTRLEASRWIRANVAPGTIVATESDWDDALPSGGGAQLQSLDLALYDPDTMEKRAALLDKLDRAQWIFVSSGRVWGSVPRLPQRWPLSSAYYRALFDGSLGFAPVREWASYPGLGPLRFPDDAAEESLVVFDHPRVVLFQKTPLWSRARADQILDASLLSDVNYALLPELIKSGWRPDEAALPVLPHPR